MVEVKSVITNKRLDRLVFIGISISLYIFKLPHNQPSSLLTLEYSDRYTVAVLHIKMTETKPRVTESRKGMQHPILLFPKSRVQY